MTVIINSVNTSIPNSGQGDTIYVAFNKVNGNEANIKAVLDNVEATYANTSLGKFANVQITNSVVGNLRLNSGWIYLNGSPVSTSDQAFSGGVVPLAVNLLSSTSSINGQTGALVVAGGAAIGENLNVGGNLSVNGSRYLKLPAGTTEQRPDAGSVEVGQIRYNTTFGLYEGYGVGSSWSSLGSVRSADGLTYISPEVAPGIGDAVLRFYTGENGLATQVMWASTSNISIIPTTASTSSSTGALQVAGGAGIGGNLSVGGNISGAISTAAQTYVTSLGTLTGLTVSGAVQPNANATVSLGSTSNYWNNFYSATATHNQVTVGGQGVSSNGAVIITNTTNNNGLSYTNGALQVYGGAGIQGNLYVQGNVYAGNLVSTSTSILSVVDPLVYLNASSPSTYNYEIGIYSHFGPYSGVAYQHTGIARDHNDSTWKIFSNVVEPAGGTISFTNAIWDKVKQGDTWIANATAASSTTTGALRVDGGVGIVKSLYVGGDGFTAITHTGDIKPSANLSYNLGSSTTWYNNIYGTAIHAVYADLAENYRGDSDYETGTVLVFGGDKEVTTTTQFADVAVAGAVSTDPAYLMNGALEGTNVTAIALRGRIPLKVVGPVAKGDLLVTAGANPGYAVSIGKSTQYPMSVFAKSLTTDSSNGPKVIEAVVI